MKRVLLRMSVLVTVVILGLIAITQAQRNANVSAAADNAASRTAARSPDRVEPIAAMAASSAPRTLPAVQANPLRSELRRTYASEAVPTAGTTDEFNPPAAQNIASTAEPPAQRATDPFGRAASTGPTLTMEIPPKPASEPTAAPVLAARTGGDTAAPSTVVDMRTVPSGLSPVRVLREPSPTAVPAASTAESSAAPQEPARFGANSLGGEPATLGGGAPADWNHSAALAPAGVPGDVDEPGRLSAIDGVPLGGNGTGTPGAKQLEGAQSPQVTIEKVAPAEIQVGKPATFRIKVRNTGKIAAHGVEIHDEIPKGTRLISTTPQASQGVRGGLVWSLGTMQPGEEMTAEVELMPLEEGEIGSVATVQLHAEASARSVATKPELLIEMEAPAEVLVGEPVLLSITISNPGTGVATGVVLEERVPAGLQHPAGTELEYDVGELKPKESRKLQLQLVAERPGQVTNVIVARGETNLKVEHRVDIQVLAPQLDLVLDGPKRRYLEREASYTVAISNPGTAPAQRVALIAQLPQGLKFVSANNSGQYVEASHTVHWQLDELPVQETGTVKLVTMPIAPGEHKLQVKASADKGLAAEMEQEVLVEGIAAILFEVVDVNDPVEKGGETTYEIRVVNQGSKAATNVQLNVQLPPQMRAIAAEGPTRHAIEANRVLFEGLSRLAPKADTTYRVRVQCLQPGDLRINVQLVSDEILTPVTKEESTRVYADE